MNTPVGMADVNIIKTGTAQGDQPDTEPAEPVNDRTVGYVVYKNADGVKAGAQIYRVRRQTRFKKFNFYVVCAA